MFCLSSYFFPIKKVVMLERNCCSSQRLLLHLLATLSVEESQQASKNRQAATFVLLFSLSSANENAGAPVYNAQMRCLIQRTVNALLSRSRLDCETVLQRVALELLDNCLLFSCFALSLRDPLDPAHRENFPANEQASRVSATCSRTSFRPSEHFFVSLVTPFWSPRCVQ